MKRRLLIVLTALSLLLCVAVVVLWVRGYWRQDVGYIFARKSYETDRIGLTSMNGWMWVGRRRVDNDIRTSPGFCWNVWVDIPSK